MRKGRSQALTIQLRLPMNRRAFLQTGILAASTFSLGCTLLHGADKKLGRHSLTEFKEITEKARAKVAALKPTGKPLSEKDKMLILEMAIGGMLQLQLSKVTFQKSSSEDVRVYARAELEEQEGMAEKLKEIAVGAKNVTLPTALDDEGKKKTARLEELSGSELDREFLSTVGIQGHESLKATMTKVSNSADDTTLKTVAKLSLPLIAIHLEVSRSEAATV